jgi:hypothetical protein
LVLGPAKARLRAHIQRAEERGRKTPTDVPMLLHELLEQTKRILFLFDLFFGQGHETRDDLYDEVAALCNQLQFAYYKKTGNNQ